MSNQVDIKSESKKLKEKDDSKNTAKTVKNKSKKGKESKDSKIKSLELEIESLKEKLLISLADKENSISRVRSENKKMVEFAKKDLLIRFLTIVDYFNMGLSFADQHKNSDSNMVIEGFRMLNNQLKDLLSSEGVSSFDSLGKKFDPDKHEVISIIEETDQEDNIIVKEHLCGYMIRNEVLRLAKVDISKRKKEINEHHTN